MIVILDYGVGNLKSIQNMIKKAGAKAHISSDKAEIEKATAVILPGVGAFDHGMNKLKESGFDELIHRIAANGTVILGICLGMQLLFERSDEGQLPGLGLVKGEVKKFEFEDSKLKIPHMGWNIVEANNSSGLYSGFEEELRYYFVHSFYAYCENPQDVDAQANYGHDFTCGVHRDNIYGAQFHPEKSHKFGVKFFQNFLEKLC